jgi:hypothetical protein
MAGPRFPAGARDFSLFLTIQTDSGTHPAFCPLGTGVKAAGNEIIIIIVIIMTVSVV